MPAVTMRELLEAGVHFGHQTRRWNPKMRRFIFAERNGIYIIDLQQTLELIESPRLRTQRRRARRHRPVRRHQEAGAGRRSATRPRASACRSSTTAGSAALLTNSPTIQNRIDAPARPAAAGADGQLDLLPTKEAHVDPARAREARDRTWAASPRCGACRRRSSCSTSRRSARDPRGAQLQHPGDRRSWTRTAIPTRSTYVIPGNDDAIRSLRRRDPRARRRRRRGSARRAGGCAPSSRAAAEAEALAAEEAAAAAAGRGRGRGSSQRADESDAAELDAPDPRPDRPVSRRPLHE